LKTEEFTFVITTFNSESTIFKCLENIPKQSKKIILENSNNKNLKNSLESRFDNLHFYLMNENLGFGKANNYGIKKTKTKYICILNPDVILEKNSLESIIEILKNEEFSIAAPINIDEIGKINFNKNNILDVKYVKGFAMIMKTSDAIKNLFDENIFLYLEEIDLCKRYKKKKNRIILVNVPVKHLGGLSHGNRDDLEMEKSRNWHWMWSKFYFNKKYYGYIFSSLVFLPSLISSMFKFFLYKFLGNQKKKLIYKMRFLGLINSYLLNSSFYRPYKKKN
tara:strand:- start:5970 stop:6806 length:837 start_codon:yes stop_codon:yes gene_type:complete